jgi:hypothetical protein
MMISRCANPLCSAPFRHGGGLLFCFPHSQAACSAIAHLPEVRHFWLCHACSETYTLENKLCDDIALKPRWRKAEPDDPPKLVAVA